MEAFEIIASVLSSEQSTADWVFEQQVMPHINAVTKHIPPQYLALCITRMPDGACRLGDIFHRHGLCKQAMELYEQILVGQEKALGLAHLDTLATVHNMASIFDDQGQHEKALEWYERALAGGKKALGVNHPDTLTTVNNMASVFDGQGQHDRALEWYERALAGKEKALGVSHPGTLTTVHNRAFVFGNQGQMGKRWSGMGEHWLEGRGPWV